MDSELDFFICKEVGLKPKPLDKFMLLAILLGMESGVKVRFRTHKRFGKTVQVVNENKQILRKYLWTDTHGFALRNRNRKRTIHGDFTIQVRPPHVYVAGSYSHNEVVATTTATVETLTYQLLYKRIIHKLCEKKGPEWIKSSMPGSPQRHHFVLKTSWTSP